MIRRKIWDTFAEQVGPLLEKNGFVGDGKGFYTRDVDDGRDQVAISIGREARCEVMISYLPDDLLALDELLTPMDELEQEHRGFPVGPYLTLVGASPNPRIWSFRTKELALKSCARIREALVLGGLPWLESLRDPARYFECAAEYPMTYGYIAERAGKVDVARATYKRWFRMSREIDEKFMSRPESEHRINRRTLIYCAIKLDMVDGVCRKHMKLLEFYPDAKPLPPE